MFPRNYFAARHFAPVYFPGETYDEKTIAAGRRVKGDPHARTNVVFDGGARPQITRGGAAVTRIKRG